MRILHVGYGFRPWVVNGLLVYSEAVMEGQADQGHEVGYFFPARQLPFMRRPFLYRWQRRGVQMFEWINSDLIVGRHRGTPSPEQDLAHASAEKAFGRVLSRFAPEVIHVHDLGGLPSSILGLGRRSGAPVVVTIHDYHALCPTVKLYDAEGRICLRTAPGEMCAVCCAHAPADNRDEVARTLAYGRARLREWAPSLDAAARSVQTRPAGLAATRLAERALGVRAGAADGASAEAYQRRRDVNLERLGQVDALIASSERSAAIFGALGVDTAAVRIAPVNPPHLDRLRPPACRMVGEPLQFVALNACNSTQKGADLLVDALGRLSRRGLDDRYRLSVHGWVAPQVQEALANHPSVDLCGDYRPEDLDRLLDGADVGLFPSVWEEVYGFAGLELLAKGIPVIGNAVGAIPDYVRPGQTGWLNRSLSAAELAELMAAAITSPAEIARLGETAAELRDELIPPFAAGLGRLMDVYRDVLAGAGPG